MADAATYDMLVISISLADDASAVERASAPTVASKVWQARP